MSEIVVTDEAGLRTIRIDRPDKKNALTRAMYAAMGDALRDAATSPAVRVVFITGGAACFTSGNDVADFKARGHVILYVSHRMEEIFRICDSTTVFRDGRSVMQVHEAQKKKAFISRMRPASLMVFSGMA